MAVIGVFLMINNLNTNLKFKKLTDTGVTVPSGSNDEEDFLNE